MPYPRMPPRSGEQCCKDVHEMLFRLLGTVLRQAVQEVCQHLIVVVVGIGRISAGPFPDRTHAYLRPDTAARIFFAINS